MLKTRRTEFAFCEPASATTRSREHIRVVGPEGRRLGGGVLGPALCGFDLRGGWDLGSDVEERRIDTSADVNPTCVECADAWRARS